MASDPIKSSRIRLSSVLPQREGIVRPERYDATMGEVRVTVELTNAWDVALVSNGYLQREQVRRCSVEALVDTGAVLTVLPASVVSQFGLTIGLTTNRTSTARKGEYDRGQIYFMTGASRQHNRVVTCCHESDSSSGELFRLSSLYANVELPYEPAIPRFE